MLRKKLIPFHWSVCTPYGTMPPMYIYALFGLAPYIERHIKGCAKTLSSVQVLLLIKRNSSFYCPIGLSLHLLAVPTMPKTKPNPYWEAGKVPLFQKANMWLYNFYVFHIIVFFCTITLDVHICRLTGFYQFMAQFSV